MSPALYRGRRAARLENDVLRVTVLREGGHIAEILDKASGVSPLWTPPWPSIEPSTYEHAVHAQYGGGVDASLLAGIMGHNLCLDIFGGPSDAEAAAGLPVHGEASLVRYDLELSGQTLVQRALLRLANLRVERRVHLSGRVVRVEESVENLSGVDRPLGWTEHVTLGPPFLEKGVTEFRTSATRSKVFERPFGSADYLVPGAEFDWPDGPRPGGGTADLRRSSAAPASSAYTAHLMDPRRDTAFFVAFSPAAAGAPTRRIAGAMALPAPATLLSTTGATRNLSVWPKSARSSTRCLASSTNTPGSCAAPRTRMSSTASWRTATSPQRRPQRPSAMTALTATI